MAKVGLSPRSEHLWFASHQVQPVRFLIWVQRRYGQNSVKMAFVKAVEFACFKIRTVCLALLLDLSTGIGAGLLRS